MLHGFLSPAPNHLVSSSIEHAAVREPLKNLETQGSKICWVPPASDGRVAASDIFNSVSPQTELVTLMGANNESGALQPIAELGSLLRTSGYAGAFVSDFTQVIGKQPCDVPALFDSGLDALSLSGHKIGAPPGVGALVFSSNPSLCRTIRPLLPGGGQEEGLRGGTENLPAIVALGEVALELLSTGEAESKKSRELRDRLWQSLSQHLPHLRRLTPEGEGALPNTLLIHTPGCRGDDLVVALDLRGVCASMGAACSSGKQQISHVATAMGLAPKEAREILRLSIDWNTSLEGVDEAARHIIEVITHIHQVQMHP
jgi:cysteine desulfurase